jgi:hypothetical protein
LTWLHRDSPQSIRCMKAVMDNLNRKRATSQDHEVCQQTKVLNVFKLQNSFLANKLQVTEYLSFFQFFFRARNSCILYQIASKKVLQAKIKGLFCVLSPQQLAVFSVFGLFAQKLPSQPKHDLYSLSEEIFRTVW